MNIGLVNGFSSITNGNGALTASKMSGEKAKFSELLETLSSSQVSEEGRLNGDYKSGFSGTYKGNNNKQASVQGAAANQANDHVKSKQSIKPQSFTKNQWNLKVIL